METVELSLARKALAEGNAEVAENWTRLHLAEQAEDVTALMILGEALSRQGRHDEACSVFGEIIFAHPSHRWEATVNRAAAELAAKRFDKAIELYEIADADRPDHPTVLAGLRVAYHETKRLVRTQHVLERLAALTPDDTDVLSNLSFSYLQQGRVKEAEATADRALAIDPNDTKVTTHSLYVAICQPDLTEADIFNRHVKWGQRHPALSPRPRSADINPERRLRVGFVSGDFHAHSLSFFLTPLLMARNPEAFDAYCYANGTREDAITGFIRKFSTGFQTVDHLSDTDLAERIREDRIDILVDLAGHTANHRLTMFQHRPAPIQVTWLGYPATTGLPAMDYRITDDIADPPGIADQLHSERLVRLPGGFLCYMRLPTAPPINPLPVLGGGPFTFGSFNTLAKMNPAVVALWAQVLQAIPNSRLLLKSYFIEDAEGAERVRAAFASHGVADRVFTRPMIPDMMGHFAAYNEIDVALDPFPYNGTTTSCEAMWMGVPILTLTGNRHSGRVGTSLLKRLDLEALVAANPEEYVARAILLTRNLPMLAEARRTMRDRMSASPLCDQDRFAREMEAAFRQMWRAHCAGQAARGGV